MTSSKTGSNNGLRSGSPRLGSGDEYIPPPQSGGSAWRGIGVGLAGVALLSWITPYVDIYLQASPLASNYLPTGVFILFLFILTVNVGLKKVGIPLSRREVLLAYMTMLVPSAISTEGLATRLITTMVGLWYYASPTNEWLTFFPRYVPDWMSVSDPDAVTWFFEGLPDGASIPWGVWVVPLASWTLLVYAVYLILTTLSIMLRRQWMVSERLQYPLVQIPMTMIGDEKYPSLAGKFFRNKIVWIAAAIPFALHFLGGLNEYFPAVPVLLPTSIRLGELFPGAQSLRERPFYVLAWVQVNFYWSVAGISYLLRSEVSLSVWVFEWLYLIEKGIFAAFGVVGAHQWSPRHGMGHTLASRYQKVGGILLAAGFYLYTARGRIRELILSALGRRGGQTGDDGESEAWVMWAHLAGVVIFLGWLTLAGMQILVAVSLLVMFLAMCVVAARIVAATGLLWVYDYYVPMHGVSKVVGTARIDPQSYTIVGFADFIALFHRSNLMPQEGDSFRMAQMSTIRTSHVLWGIGLGIVLACVVSYAMVLNLAYTHGGLNLQQGLFKDLQVWLWNRIADRRRYQLGTNWMVVSLMSGGAATMGGLFYMHRHYLWWPLYPLMFLFGDTRASNQLWFPVLVGWLVKLCVMRLGGFRAYSKFKSAAIGLIIGEFLAVAFWLVVSAKTGHIGHKVFPDFTPS